MILGFLQPGLGLDGIPNVDVSDAGPSTDTYVLAYNDSLGIFELQAPGSGGVTDHGALTGLSDDDHTHYHTDARHDARSVGTHSDVTLTSPSANDILLVSGGVLIDGNLGDFTTMAGTVDAVNDKLAFFDNSAGENRSMTITQWFQDISVGNHPDISVTGAGVGGKDGLYWDGSAFVPTDLDALFLTSLEAAGLDLDHFNDVAYAVTGSPANDSLLIYDTAGQQWRDVVPDDINDSGQITGLQGNAISNSPSAILTTLRYNNGTGQLDWTAETSVPTVEYDDCIQLRCTSNINSIGTSWGDQITWNASDIKTSNFTHSTSTNNDEITVDVTAKVLFTVAVTIEYQAGTLGQVTVGGIRLEDDTGGSFAAVTGAIAYGLVPHVGSARMTIILQWMQNMTSGDKVRISVTETAGTGTIRVLGGATTFIARTISDGSI